MNNIPSKRPYELEIEVQQADIDQLGHVNNVVYLKWVQEAAAAHWYASATERQKTRLLWVVARHEIDYKRPVKENDDVLVRTWVGKATRRLFERHTEILRKSDRKVFAKAISLWVPVDIDTKKPVTPGPDVYDMFSS